MLFPRLSGEYIVVNKHLLEDLVELGLWNNEMKENIMRANGSIQHIDVIPQELKELYKTKHVNSWPFFTSFSARCDPINPSEPVNNIFMIYLYYFFYSYKFYNF